MTSARLGAVCAAIATVLGAYAPVRAQDEQPVDVPARPGPRIHLSVAAEPPVAAALDERLRPRLDGLGVNLEMSVVARVDLSRVLDGAGGATTGDPEAPLAQGWLDARAPQEVALVLIPRDGERVLARRIALASGLDEVALAEIAYIVDRAVQTLLASEPVGVPRAEARALLAPPAARAVVAPVISTAKTRTEPARPLVLQLGVAAGAQGWSDDAPVLPAAGLSLLLERGGQGWRIGGVWDVAVRGDAHATTADARIVARGGDAHLCLALARAFSGSAWRLALGPGIAVGYLQTTPSATTTRTVAAQARTDVDPVLGASLRWDRSLSPRTTLFVVARADVVLRPARYTAVVDGNTTTIFTTWPVRPSLVIGAAFDLTFGE